jgi:E3 ubiquitin-protein ligase HUWE1
MGKVKQSKKSYAPPSDDVVRFVDAVAKSTDVQLVPLLARLDVWRFSRGDLHGWIPALDRFDGVLEGIVKNYELDKPQLNPFTPHDKTLLLEVLRVYRLLLENCTSRKLFASYDVSHIFAKLILAMLRSPLHI